MYRSAVNEVKEFLGWPRCSMPDIVVMPDDMFKRAMDALDERRGILGEMTPTGDHDIFFKGTTRIVKHSNAVKRLRKYHEITRLLK